MKKILVAMSGGVDSAVAAYLLKRQGYTCVGATMRLFDEAACCSTAHIEDARAVADRLSIPHHVFNLSADFRAEVIGRFASAYERGATPNPCVECNRRLKFGRLLDCALALSCDAVATGHYARIEEKNGRFLLKKAADPAKDQSYVLYSLTQRQLSRATFPLGALNKAETRAIAAEQGFANAQKRESQDICFAPDGDYAAAIARHTGKTYPPGNFVDKQGNILGQHKGIIRYTIGQRKGLGLALPQPMYVCEKNVAENTVVLGYNEDLLSTEIYAADFNWIPFDAPPSPLRVKAKIRYSQTESPATATALPDGRVKLVFDTPQRAPSPGQAAVLYDGSVVLGGGTIL